jgi:NAD(P)-dependent dehydrogenase (short-subunit alcohol dehydrogenase family)
MKLDGIEGRVALVTGGGRGIGRAIAETLRDQGARVADGDLRAPEVEGVLGVELDVTRSDSVDAAFERVESELGPVELLVLNAGVYIVEPFEETSLESWQQTIDVNLTGAFLCARRALPAMRERQFGRIVAIGSSAGKTGGKKHAAAYGASKAGIMVMTKAIASEYAEHGITANALAPALIDTEMVAGIRDLVGLIPVGRLGTAEEVAGVVAYLCSTQAAYITGEVVDVNGGFLID